MKVQPPHWAQQFFEWYCASYLIEELQGDLFEEFEFIVQTRSVRRARWNYVLQVFLLIGPHTLRRTKSNHSNLTITMFKNYLLVAFRSLLKRKTYTAINIGGLAVGISCSLLILAFVQQELSYDQFHSKSDRIYRANMAGNFGGQEFQTLMTPTALMPTLKRELPEIEEGVRVYNPAMFSPTVVAVGEKQFEESRFFYADSTFFRIFSFPLIEGNPTKVLNEVATVVLTKSAAKRYFGDEHPVGKLIRVNDSRDYTITGLMEDVPANSHVKFDFVASFHSLRAAQEEIWWSANYFTYFLLKEGATLDQLNNQMPGIFEKYLKSQMPTSNDAVSYQFTPIKDIHLYSKMNGELEPGGNITYVYIFSIIAGLILLIACINYMNLATAKAAERAKEVGVRKVMGAYRGQIFRQFMSEATLITGIALLIAFGLMAVLIPYFNQLTGKQLNSALIYDPQLIGGMLMVGVMVAFISGSYPALALSKFKPVSVLKGSFKNSKSGGVLRKGLVVFQFAVSLFLIFCTLVVYKQLSYIRSKDLGYTKEQVLVVPIDWKVKNQINALRTELKKNGAVKSVSLTANIPSDIKGVYGFYIEGMSENEMMRTNAANIDHEYASALNLRFLAGENINEADFERGIPKEEGVVPENTFLVNERIAKLVGKSPEELIGTPLIMGERKGKIKGVFQDFHFESLYQPIGALILYIEPDQANYMIVKLDSDQYTNTLAAMETSWKSLVTHRPFAYQFLDQNFEAMYITEQRMGHVFNTFSIIAIFIACLGLFGLASYTAIQRAKEIGVRKVLGASSGSVVVLLSKDFVKLIVVAMLLALPLAYWAMFIWLDDFAFKTSISWWIPIMAGLLTIGTALFTISFESWKAANTNPVNSLKTE